MLEKFKVGDEIWFMESNKPKSEIVKGIAVFNGHCKTLHDDVDASEIVIVRYYYDSWGYVNHSNVFATKEELKDSLF